MVDAVNVEAGLLKAELHQLGKALGWPYRLVVRVLGYRVLISLEPLIGLDTYQPLHCNFGAFVSG